MAREISIWMHSGNLGDGDGQTTDIVLNANSYWFAARPIYGSSGNDPVLGPWGVHRYEDWAELSSQSSATPTLHAAPAGDYWLLNYQYPGENAADFGGFYFFKHSGRLGIATRATSLSPEIRGVEIIEYPFG